MLEYIKELLEHGFIIKSTPRYDIVKYRGNHYFRLLKRNEQYCKITARSWPF